MKEIKISIVTVCFNSAKTIERTLKSVTSQTYPNMEYIIIDGASTDNTLEIVSRYSSRIAHVISEKDQGIYDAMNKGWALAIGDFVHFLNSDDWYCSEQSLQNFVDQMRATSVDQNAFDSFLWHGKMRYHESNNEVFVMGGPLRNDKDMPLQVQSVHQPASLFPKKAYVECGLFDLQYKIASDFDFTKRVLNKFPARFVDVELVNMAWGGVSAKNQKRAMWENIDVCRQHGENVFKVYSFYLPRILKVHLREHWPNLFRCLKRLKTGLG